MSSDLFCKYNLSTSALDSSPSRSPHGGPLYEMYMQAVRERDSLKESKAEVDKLYLQNRTELIDTENLLKTFQQHFDETGKKYQDALNKIDHMSSSVAIRM